jgi:DNA repair exonuclease SbcCD nuclease subunit
MRIVHASDLHIGFRDYDKLSRAGVNAREVDVAQTFARHIDAWIAERPDVIAIAGDVFHSPRPSNLALQHTMVQFRKLTAALPSTVVVIVAGNHDQSPGDGGCALPLLEHVGVTVVSGRSRWLSIRDGELALLCVPDVIGLARPEFVPKADARFSAVLMHGEVAGVTQGGADKRPSLKDVQRDDLHAESFAVVMLGHYHIREQVGPNAFYSGAIDYTSSNVWPEREHEKGYYVHDLAAGTSDFRVITPRRRFYDLEPISARGLTPAAVDALIADRLASVDIDDAVVRLIVDDIRIGERHALDQRAIKAFRLRAMSLKIDYRSSDDEREEYRALRRQRVEEVNALADRSMAAMKRRPLRDRLVSMLDDRAATGMLSADVNADELRTLALSYFDRTNDPTARPTDAEDAALSQQLVASIDSTNNTLLKRTA